MPWMAEFAQLPALSNTGLMFDSICSIRVPTVWTLWYMSLRFSIQLVLDFSMMPSRLSTEVDFAIDAAPKSFTLDATAVT